MSVQRYRVCYTSATMPELSFQRVKHQGEHWWRVTGLRYTLLIRAGLRPDGRLACRQLLIEADEVGAKGLREIPLGLVMDKLAKFTLPSSDEPGLFSAPTSAWLKELKESGEWPATQPPPPRPRRSAVTDALLIEVAAKYLKSGAQPMKALALIRGKSDGHKWSDGERRSKATLQRLLRIARKKSLLGPAIHGKAGQARPAKKSSKRTPRRSR
jgi:hypothetical protein